jgi:glutathione-independent formaldehyde dehydrogenase
VYLDQDPGGVDGPAKQGKYLFPLGVLWGKGLTVGTDQTPVKRYNLALRNLILGGRAKPGFIVSHHIPIDQAPAAYEKFDKKAEGYTKVVITFRP